MNYQTAIDGALVMVLLLDLAMLSAERLTNCIRTFAMQSALLAVLPLAEEVIQGGSGGFHGYILLFVTIGMKSLLIPWVLMRTVRSGEVHREVQPLIGFTTSVFIGALMIAGSFAVGAKLTLPERPISNLLVPTGLSTLLIGLLILVSRTKAITQVLGYLVVENGVYLFGISLIREMPLLVELGILLDLFVAVFVMAIVVYHIRQEFDHMDTHNLDQLREGA